MIETGFDMPSSSTHAVCDGGNDNADGDCPSWYVQTRNQAGAKAVDEAKARALAQQLRTFRAQFDNPAGN
ncbi:hypothetical protein Trco_004498 [Trichoderma cornu-damae]|uniref:Uncharacterized protein n=1 Tax=Trichoderma cornu-damae TaxID=654480 RepID=A0A9P8QMN0_9HYPO|nr:hypothetical protein Trco_004498 [Trichoderma cornu-damae]